MVTLSGDTSATAMFTSPIVTAEALTFRLTVTDDEGTEASDEVTVRVEWYVDVSVGGSGYACALRETSTVKCSGFNGQSIIIGEQGQGGSARGRVHLGQRRELSHLRCSGYRRIRVLGL